MQIGKYTVPSGIEDALLRWMQQRPTFTTGDLIAEVERRAGAEGDPGLDRAAVRLADRLVAREKKRGNIERTTEPRKHAIWAWKGAKA